MAVLCSPFLCNYGIWTTIITTTTTTTTCKLSKSLLTTKCMKQGSWEGRTLSAIQEVASPLCNLSMICHASLTPRAKRPLLGPQQTETHSVCWGPKRAVLLAELNTEGGGRNNAPIFSNSASELFRYSPQVERFCGDRRSSRGAGCSWRGRCRFNGIS